MTRTNLLRCAGQLLARFYRSPRRRDSLELRESRHYADIADQALMTQHRRGAAKLPVLEQVPLCASFSRYDGFVWSLGGGNEAACVHQAY
jgi:hypothetical protein